MFWIRIFWERIIDSDCGSFLMKIMIITSIFPPGFLGGFELAALDIARGLKQKGHDICVVTSAYFLDYEQKLNDFPVHRILESIAPYSLHQYHDRETEREGFLLNYHNIRQICNLLMQIKPDCILFFDTRGLGTLGLIKYVTDAGFRPVMNLGDDIFAEINNPKLNIEAFYSIFGPLNFLSKVKSILNSKNLEKIISKSLGFPLPDQIIIPRWYKNYSQEINWHDKHKSEIIQFIFVAAALTEHKGIYILIESVKRLLAEGFTNFVVDLYGIHNATTICQTIITSQLENYIRYRGIASREQMPAILLNYDALVFPTWEKEAFGKVAIEAAGFGCIPIATLNIGAMEWFLHGFDCFKIERNVNELATAMIKFIKMPREDKIAMSQNCALTAAKSFDFDSVMNQTEEVIFSAFSAQDRKHQFKPVQAQAAMLVLKNLWEKKINAVRSP
jgi:glycogen(starch) synthase